MVGRSRPDIVAAAVGRLGKRAMFAMWTTAIRLATLAGRSDYPAVGSSLGIATGWLLTYRSAGGTSPREESSSMECHCLIGLPIHKRRDHMAESRIDMG
jgi:hypothetical protein